MGLHVSDLPFSLNVPIGPLASEDAGKLNAAFQQRPPPPVAGMPRQAEPSPTSTPKVAP